MIELTKAGRSFIETAEANHAHLQRFGEKLKTIRNQYGFPHWEIKKALANAAGDTEKAMTALRQLVNGE